MARGNWRDWFDAAVAFIYPEVCQICGERRAGASKGFVCQDCAQKVKFITHPFCSRCGLPYQGMITAAFECSNCRDFDLHFRFARSAVTTGGPVLEAIHRYKYNGALWFEPFLSGLLEREACADLKKEDWDYLVPVPLHPSRQRTREFNQAERLCRRLAVASGIPVNTRLLKRTEATRTQTQLTRSQRAANVRRAFALRQGANPAGARIVVFDDVLTTGATTNACARVLRESGAADVCVWTVARGVPHP